MPRPGADAWLNMPPPVSVALVDVQRRDQASAGFVLEERRVEGREVLAQEGPLLISIAGIGSGPLPVASQLVNVRLGGRGLDEALGEVARAEPTNAVCWLRISNAGAATRQRGTV